MTLYELTDELYRLYEFAEDIDTDDQAFKDTLEALTGEIEDKADGYAKVIRQIESDVDGIQKEIDRLTARRDALKNNVKRMKEALQQTMIALDKPKFKTELFSFYIQKNKASVVIDDEDAIPDEYYVTKREISKSKISDAINEGKNITFAHLSQSESLRIR